MKIRTRFAPSPTGSLHIGGARTALYSWLYAKHHNGDFILRIEDTDLERSTKESHDAILEAMDWLGLDYSEGPFYQSKRFDRYEEVLAQLLDEDKAYRCYCSKERLEKLRQEQIEKKQKPRYDGYCRELPKKVGEQAHVIRFRNPTEGETVVNDLIHDKITFQNTELDDLIIARTDGTPTYNFTVVVDDMDMNVTHVIRGDDHINNTPRQINILSALGAELPQYAHLSMILGDDGKRLSKRHGAVNVTQYRDEGYLPEALLNYLVRLGWSKGDQEIFSIEEMIEHFDIKDVNKSAAAFNPEKLLWVNQHYLMHGDVEHVTKHLQWHMAKLDLALDNGPDLSEVVKIQRERCKTLREMAERSVYFYQDDVSVDDALLKKHFKPEIIPVLKEVYEKFSQLDEWAAEAIHKIVIDTAEAHELKLGKLAQPIRVAITGGTVSPPIDVTLELLGKQRTLARLQRCF